MSLFKNPVQSKDPRPQWSGQGKLFPHEHNTRDNVLQTQIDDAAYKQYQEELEAWRQRNPGKMGGSKKRKTGTKKRAARKGKRKSNRNKK